jgi:hypothetical protein
MPDCIPRLEIFGLFILASQTHVADLYLLLQILQQSLEVRAVFFLGYEKTMLALHMALVVLKTAVLLQAEQTPCAIFLKDDGGFFNFRLRLNDRVRVMPFGLHVLFEGIGGCELLPALIADKLIVFLFLQLFHFVVELLLADGSQLDHLPLEVVAMVV